jgi:hypothetical protein
MKIDVLQRAKKVWELQKVLYHNRDKSLPLRSDDELKSILRNQYNFKPRVSHVFATIPWTSIVRYFYTAFTAYCEESVLQSFEAAPVTGAAPVAPSADKPATTSDAKMPSITSMAKSGGSSSSNSGGVNGATAGASAKAAHIAHMERLADQAARTMNGTTADSGDSISCKARHKINLHCADMVLDSHGPHYNIKNTPAVHFMKARILLLDAMITMIKGDSPVMRKGDFDHHREFAAAVWAAGTGKFIKSNANAPGTKDSLTYQRSLTNSALVRLGLKPPKTGGTRPKENVAFNSVSRFGHLYSLPSGSLIGRDTAPNALDNPTASLGFDEITSNNVVEVGKCAINVSYIGVPWKDFRYVFCYTMFFILS